MKLSQSLNEALNFQVLHELRNQTRYMQICSYFEDLQLNNIAKFFKEQAEGEHGHAELFMQYINDRTGGKVEIGEIDAPQLSLTGLNSVGDNYVKVEEDTTLSIESIFELALNERSYIDLPFLQKMLEEQVEEEDTANKFSARIKLVKDPVLFDATFKHD